MNVLVTGSSGAIGRPVCAELARQGDMVRGFDRVQADEPHEMFLGQIEQAEHVRQAMRGMDAVIHLAANPYDAPFPELIGPNVLGLYHVLDAARSEGVRRVVLASSVQVAGTRTDRRMTAEQRAPSNHYALTKVLAEEMGAMYAHRFALDVIAARIGWVVRDEREARRMAELKLFHIYVSRADIARFFTLSVHAEFSGFAVLWAMGSDGRERFDLEPARRAIGYEPQEAWPEGLSFPLPSVPSPEP